MHEIQSQSLFLWYDYFSCPQLEPNKADVTNEKDGSCLARAIKSIPAHHPRPVLHCLVPSAGLCGAEDELWVMESLARGAAAAWCGGAGINLV